MVQAARHDVLRLRVELNYKETPARRKKQRARNAEKTIKSTEETNK